MRKKIIIAIFFIAVSIWPAQSALAQDKPDINIYFFWGEGCPHCEKEKPFLEGMKARHPAVRIHSFEISKSAENRSFLTEMGKKLNISVSGVPFTVVGDKYFSGWYDEKSTGAAIEEAVRCAEKDGCRDVGREIPGLAGRIGLADGHGHEEGCGCEEEKSTTPQKIKVPLFGEIETKNFSLPLLTVVLGALDGFNPCAMWVLLFLISLLVGMRDRRRMWILGIVFIAASAAVYFVFMAAWLNFILFIGVVAWVRIFIGLIALAGGGYNLKEFFSNPEGTCKVTGTEKRQKVFERLKNITHEKSFYLALGGIIILAFAVNLVELICSAGLPAVYVQVLALSDLAKWQYYAYIFLYILVFMLDDLFVFFVAMTTLRVTGITTKYSRLSHLIGGALMVAIGLVLIFRPGWLMFG